MPGQVKVDDFEVFRLFRAAMLKFAQGAERALSSADGEIASTHSWLETEQATYWQNQLRKRSEAVMAAREEVRKKKMYKDFTGRTPDASQEEKTLAKCKKAVEHAEEKLVAVKKALPKLEKEAEMYRGAVSRLNGVVTVDVPKAVMLLDRLAARLEEYVQIENAAGEMAAVAGDSGSDSASAALAPIGESMSRGGDDDPAAPAHAPKQTPAAAAEKSTETSAESSLESAAAGAPPKEGPHVPDGK